MSCSPCPTMPCFMCMVDPFANPEKGCYPVPCVLVASDCGWSHSWIPFLHGWWLKILDEVETSCCEFLLNPRIISTTRRERLMKDGSESFKMTGCILQNHLVFSFYLLPNELNVHGKEFLGSLVFVFGMHFSTYGSTQHLHKGL